MRLECNTGANGAGAREETRIQNDLGVVENAGVETEFDHPECVIVRGIIHE